MHTGVSDSYVALDASFYYYDQASGAMERQSIEMDDSIGRSSFQKWSNFS
jgi:hypothetical protein